MKSSQVVVVGNWRHWKAVIIKVANMESKRSSIKKLLEQYDIQDGITYENGNKIYIMREISSLNNYFVFFIPDYQDYIAIQLLLKLLYPRSTKGILYKQVVVGVNCDKLTHTSGAHFPLQTNDVELSADHSDQLEPFGVIVGEVGSGEAQYLLYGERRFILESKGFIEMILDVVGTYFNFDICYPKSLISILLFFHYYIFEIDHPKKLPEPLLNFIRLSQ